MSASVPCTHVAPGGNMPCPEVCRTWRQCPMPGCKLEEARCEAHGGDKRAVQAMLEHIATHATDKEGT